MNQLETLKPLSLDQYTRCKENAVKRISREIGDKPQRANFKRDYAPLLGILDYLAFIVFLAAFVVSSMHIINYSGEQANLSFIHTTADILGIQIGATLFGVAHQVGFLLLAEFSMILFFVQFKTRSGYDRYVSLGLALLAMAFVIVSNLESGLNPFLSLLAPFITIGVGFRAESIIAEQIKRNAEIDSRYRSELEVWEISKDSPENHPDYQQALASEIWERLINLKANQGYQDVTAEFKMLAVQRELKKDHWSSETEPSNIPMFGGIVDKRPLDIRILNKPHDTHF